MEATLNITGLSVQCIFGAFSHEREEPREILLDLALVFDISNAAQSDKLSDTVNYHQIATALRTFLTERRYYLLEAACAGCIQMVMDRWSQINQCTITLTKPGAIPLAKSTALTLKLIRE